MPFRNTKVDYIIFVAASVTLIYSVLTVDVVYYGDTNISEEFRFETGYYYYDLNVQLVLAPIILIHRIFIMLAGEYKVKRLKERNVKLKFKIWKIKLFERIKKDIDILSNKQKFLAMFLWGLMFFFIIFLVGVIFGR